MQRSRIEAYKLKVTADRKGVKWEQDNGNGRSVVFFLSGQDTWISSSMVGAGSAEEKKKTKL